MLRPLIHTQKDASSVSLRDEQTKVSLLPMLRTLCEHRATREMHAATAAWLQQLESSCFLRTMVQAMCMQM